MSFSSDVKSEVSKVLSSHKHCRITELVAMFQLGGDIGRLESDCYTVGFHTENSDVTKKGFTLLRKTINIDLNNVLSEELLLQFMEDMNELEEVVVEYLLHNSCCRRAYVRGAFLCVGSISDPQKGYHFEFVCEDEEQAVFLKNIIATFEIDMKIIERKGHFVLYIKEGTGIVDLLNVIEAHVALMELENIRIVKEMRNTINRRVNCEAANIHKTVSAASKQVDDIKYIQATQGLESLSDALYDMAQIRLEYPEMALKELGELLDPPVGKSGVNHRLRKLSELAARLREKYN
ncbi:MAG: DNA-binding protein WhiA [Lachnospiraceae bacterium]